MDQPSTSYDDSDPTSTDRETPADGLVSHPSLGEGPSSIVEADNTGDSTGEPDSTSWTCGADGYGFVAPTGPKERWGPHSGDEYPMTDTEHIGNAWRYDVVTDVEIYRVSTIPEDFIGAPLGDDWSDEVKDAYRTYKDADVISSELEETMSSVPIVVRQTRNRLHKARYEAALRAAILRIEFLNKWPNAFEGHGKTFTHWHWAFSLLNTAERARSEGARVKFIWDHTPVANANEDEPAGTDGGKPAGVDGGKPAGVDGGKPAGTDGGGLAQAICRAWFIFISIAWLLSIDTAWRIYIGMTWLFLDLISRCIDGDELAGPDGGEPTVPGPVETPGPVGGEPTVPGPVETPGLVGGEPTVAGAVETPSAGDPPAPDLSNVTNQRESYNELDYLETPFDVAAHLGKPVFALSPQQYKEMQLANTTRKKELERLINEDPPQIDPNTYKYIYTIESHPHVAYPYLPKLKANLESQCQPDTPGMQCSPMTLQQLAGFWQYEPRLNLRYGPKC